MQSRETSEHLLSSLLAVIADGLAIFAGLSLAVWLRFESGLFHIDPVKGVPPLDTLIRLIFLVTVIFLGVFRYLQLFKRPHQGRFEDKIPRILRAIFISYVVYFAVESALKLDPPFSRKALLISLFIVTFFVLLERYIIYRIELHQARHAPTVNRVLIIGTDPSAIRLGHAIESDKFLRAKIVGFLKPDTAVPWPDSVPKELRKGNWSEVEPCISDLKPNNVVLSDIGFERDQLLRLVMLCEQNYISFHLVPDLFRILTSDLEVRHLEGIPIMGLGQWPLDQIGARVLKRLFDIGFSFCALLAAFPIIATAAILIKLTSKGPVFYRQERCGEQGKLFHMVKLRTMVAEAEQEGPGWTTPDDPRRTRIGSFLRKWNIDELPQFWNVLLGHMSVVGPRPERPHYVEQFKDEIERYMRRHVHKPGITGWAQVHGLRGDTSIQERITYDLFYLENWSLGLDIKIILKTIASRENAY
jgi:exopolysaccharide biosynthesis polyprenyl glycosylphosphotransferase